MAAVLVKRFIPCKRKLTHTAFGWNCNVNNVQVVLVNFVLGWHRWLMGREGGGSGGCKALSFFFQRYSSKDY